MTDLETDATVTRTHIARQLEAARARTLGLVDCLTDDEQCRPVSPLMSPFVWDLAHIGNYEELWLLREIDGRAAIDPTLDDLYNAFEHPRWERPSLPILNPREARAYDARVRDDVLTLLATVDPGDRPDRPLLDRGFVYGMVIQHEQQHDETLLATHQLRGEDAVAPPGPVPNPAPEIVVGPHEVLVEGGPAVIGTDDAPWAYDNERGAHEVEVAPFFIDATPVTNRQYLEFIADGGYRERRVWSDAGWGWRNESSAEAPGFWRAEGQASWSVLRFGARFDVARRLDEPVQHVSWHEAQAFARWSGQRLPTEVEWEKAATWDPSTGTKRRYPWGDAAPDESRANLGQRHAGPSPVGRLPGRGERRWRARADRRRLGVDDIDLPPLPRLRGLPLPRVLGGVLGRRLLRAARGLVGRRCVGRSRHLPQLGLPHPSPDLQRLPLRPGRLTPDMCRFLVTSDHRSSCTG